VVEAAGWKGADLLGNIEYVVARDVGEALFF
jgi:hypothetical protein